MNIQNNAKFSDTMHRVNSYAKKNGFTNGIHWASVAFKKGLISEKKYEQYQVCHELRNNYAHGNSMDILVSNETLSIVERFERDIRRLCGKPSKKNSHNSHSHTSLKNKDYLRPIIFIVDTSMSMCGEYISSVNNAIYTVLSNNIISKNTRIGIITFSSGAGWITDGLMEPDTIYNFYLEAGGITDFGAALNELNQNLSLNETWKNDSLIFNPVLFFITDGFPTDNWELALENLITDNKWFNHATKLGIAIGEDADQQILAKITESNKTVIKIKDLSNFKELLEIMCTTAISNDSYKKSIGIEDALRILTEVQTTSESFAYSINFMHTTGIS